MRFPRRLRHLAAAVVLITTLLPSIARAQQPQPTFWPADRIVALTTERVNLRGRDNSSVSLPVAYVRNLMEAKQRIEQQAGLNARLYVTDFPRGGPNAFATVINGSTLIAFNVQMMQLVGHDPDMIAAVMGHEVAHHVRGHLQQGRSREAVVELIGIIAGIALEKKIQEKHNVAGLGLNIANLGTTLANRKFDRDQEREADSVGLEWMAKAGYDPNGAVRVWEKMRQTVGDNSSLFNTHPASSERIENMRREIAAMGPLTPRTSVAVSTSAPVSHGSSDVAAAPTTTAPTGASALPAAMEAYQQGDYKRAALLWQQAERDTHDSRAQFALAMLHLQGKGVARDRAAAFGYMKKAADQGNVAAQTNIAQFYLAGIATPRDPGKAREYLEKAVASGNPDAKARLALVLLGDAGDPADRDRALKLADEAADAGRPYGYFAKGVYYLRPPTRNDAEAATWIRKAVDNQVVSARAALAGLYREGRGVEKSDVKAVEVLQPAVHAGDGRATAELGLHYMRGQGVTKDPAKACELFERAMSAGFLPAAMGLGLAYHKGEGRPKDLAQAWAYYSLAVSRGARKTAEEGMREIAGQLSANELQEAQRRRDALVASWASG